MSSDFNLQHYLKRIGFEGQPQANLQTLVQLMQAQLCTVPFENLDVQAGKIVSLNQQEIIEKIVHHNQGGYCYEVNGLFAMALEAIGISYRFVMARPMFYPTKRPKTHAIVIATVEGQEFICDLGFGNYGLSEPFPLANINEAILQGFNQFRLIAQDDSAELILQAYVDGDWKSQFAFDASLPADWLDFVLPNYFNSTHPDTIFVQKLLVLKHNPHGRKILLGNELISITELGTVRKNIPTEQIPSILKREFGLNHSRLDKNSK